MSDRRSYEVVVVGGGPAGMTTSLYTTRLGHRTAVFEAEGGRHASVSHVHNLFGVSEDVSGRELSKHAVDQFEEYGGTYYLDAVEDVRQSDDGFVVEAGHGTVEAERVVFATGFSDREPDVPELLSFTGRGLHYCLHCDAYTLGDGPVFVLGHDDHAATVAMLMLNFTADVDLLLDGHEPEWSEDVERQLRAHPVDVVEASVVGAFPRAERVVRPRGGHRRENGERSEFRQRDRPVARRPHVRGRGEWSRGHRPRVSRWVRDVRQGVRHRPGRVAGLCAGRRRRARRGRELRDQRRRGVRRRRHHPRTEPDGGGDGRRRQGGDGRPQGPQALPAPPEDLDDAELAEVPAAAADLRARMRLVRNYERHAGLRDPRHTAEGGSAGPSSAPTLLVPAHGFSVLATNVETWDCANRRRPTPNASGRSWRVR